MISLGLILGLKLAEHFCDEAKEEYIVYSLTIRVLLLNCQLPFQSMEVHMKCLKTFQSVLFIFENQFKLIRLM